MNDELKKQTVVTKIRSRKVFVVGVIIFVLLAVVAAITIVFILRNSSERILTDSISNSLKVDKTKFTVSYAQAPGGTGLKTAKIDGSYDKTKGYAGDASAVFDTSGYRVAVTGKVALDMSSKAYYLYDTVDDAQTTNEAYRMSAESQQAVQDNYKAKWTVVDADALGDGSSCVFGLLQRSQKDPIAARTLVEAALHSGGVNVHTESSSGNTAVYSVAVTSNGSDGLIKIFKDAKQLTDSGKCDADATDSIASALKRATIRVSVDTKQRQIKEIAIETKEASGANKITVQMSPDTNAQVTIPADAKSVQVAE